MVRRPATDRLTRLLALPAWVAENNGASIDEAASHFKVSPATIRRDVETLWLSGLPGGMPDDLIDFDADAYEAGRLSLTDAQGLDRPVRLTQEEAVSLLLSLRVLDGLLAADAQARTAISQAQDVLTLALGEGDAPAGPLAPPAPGTPPAAAPPAAGGQGAPSPEVLSAVRQALDKGRRLHLVYVSATDRRTVRDVDPVELLSDGSHLTLRAWCLSSAGERSFRLDRVLEAQVLDTRSTPHRSRRRPTAPRPTARLHLAPTGRWLTEQVPTLQASTNPDGTITAVVEGRDEEWLIGLVLSTGRHLLAVEPPRLAWAAARRAQAALAADPAADKAFCTDPAPTPTVEQDARQHGAPSGPR